MDNQHLKQTVCDLFELTKDGGNCFFTMMSIHNSYSNIIASRLDNGLCEVNLDNGRLKEVSYINFVEDEEKLKEIFLPFQTLYIGEYDFYNIGEKYGGEGSGHHYIFIGEKESKK